MADSVCTVSLEWRCDVREPDQQDIEKLLSMGSTDSGTSVVMAQVDRELIEAILKLAKLADRPVAAYFNVDGHTLSETIAEPMDASIKDMNKLKDMLKGVRW